MSMHLAIVAPCYNEEAVLPETARRLLALLAGLAMRGAEERAALPTRMPLPGGSLLPRSRAEHWTSDAEKPF